MAIPDQPGFAHDELGPEELPGPLVAPEDLVELDAAPAPAPPTGSPSSAGHRPRPRQRLRAAVVPAFVVALVLLGATILVSASWRSEDQGPPLVVLAAGGALSVMAGVLIFALGRSREYAYQLVDAATVNLRQREDYYRALVQHGHDLIVVADADWQVQYVSPSVAVLLGFDAADLRGKPVPDGLHPAGTELARAAVGGSASGEVRIRHRDGTWRSFEGVISDLRDVPAITGYVISIHDITEREAAAEELAHHATHDALTELPNRVLLLDRLDHALARAGRVHSTVAVLFLDLDRFKIVNDSLGHHAGDELLQEAARRIRAVAREADTVARFGGDEFVLICEDVDGVEEALAIAGRLTQQLEQPIRLVSCESGGEDTVVGASIGIALSPAGRLGGEELIRDADAAMYRAKAKGGGAVELFDESMRSQAVRRLRTETLLRQSLDTDRFEVVYQPIHDLRDSSVVGVEALVRWDHPERGLVGPDEFLSVAEETGLIVPLGAWVVDQACRQVGEWTAAATAQGRHLDLTLAVNLSARQLSHGELVGTVARAFAILGEQEEHPALCLELRESVLNEEPMSAVSTLERLRQMGVRIGIDDFGTGAASLGDVKHLPIDVLKVDRDFVSGVDASTGDAVIIAAVIRLAEDLGLTVIAEGVETAEQADLLRRLGCRQAQGYHFSRPQRAEDVALLLGVAVS